MEPSTTFGICLPALKAFYDGLFTLCSYTRNGLFYAPVFLVLGGFLADCTRRPTAKTALCGFALCAALLLGEGLTLRALSWQRHDSMYIFLVPCAVFLFCALLTRRGKGYKALCTGAMALYILHPMAIVAVRMAAKFTGSTALLVQNSGVHYLAVVALSALGAAVVTLVGRRFAKSTPAPTPRAWVEVDADNLRHNAKTLQAALPPGCALMAVVKAEAYGHGAGVTAACLQQAGVRAFAVATLAEGITLRKNGIEGEILILGYTPPANAGALHRWRLTQTLVDAAYAKALAAQRQTLQAHIKIDTGMHRLGFDCADPDAAAAAFALPKLRITGIYTHLCAADSLAPQDVEFTNQQIQRFYALLAALRGRGIHPPKTHIQSSYGLLNYPQLQCDYARIGIALYGAASAPGCPTRLRPALRPVLSLKATVALVRSVPAGQAVGYQRAFVAQRDSVIAILTIGYADGLPRCLPGGRGAALLHGQAAPMVGRICMDQLAVDVTDLPDVHPGDTATLIGGGNTADTVAAAAGTIANELLSRLGVRLVR